MVNPAGPLGRVTGRSATKLHGDDSNDPGEAVQHSRSGKSRGLGQHLQQLEKIQGRPQAAASRYESRKPVIITDFSILATRQAIKKPIQRQRRCQARPRHGRLTARKKPVAAVFRPEPSDFPRQRTGDGCRALKNNWAGAANRGASQSKLR